MKNQQTIVKLQKQQSRLKSKWATGRASKKEMMACMDLDRKISRLKSQNQH